jgi:hypothetical protein
MEKRVGNRNGLKCERDKMQKIVREGKETQKGRSSRVRERV